MTTTVPDVDQIQHLDFTPTCQCDCNRCGRPPATHIVTLRCGCAVLYCPGCIAAIKQMIRAHPWVSKASCNLCGRVYHDVWTCQLFVSIKPL